MVSKNHPFFLSLMTTIKSVDYSASLAKSGSSPDLTPPTGYSVQQLVANLAAGVMAAYNAFNDPSDPNVYNSTPSLSGYGNVQTIWVSEVGEIPVTGSEYQVFGFAAAANDNTHNIVVLRGTATAVEAGYDLYEWDTNTPCTLPVDPSATNPQSYGNVKQSLYNFYATGPDPLSTYDDSLASSFNTAVQAVAASSSASMWYVAGHSLGGPMATLGALDAYLNGSFGSNQPTLVTFGGLHLGDLSFVTDYMNELPQGLRIANQCDFVPSLVALEPSGTPPSDPYAALGQPGTFVWQNWDDWANHSMLNVYQPMVTYAGQNSDPDYWDMITFGASQTYPQPG